MTESRQDEDAMQSLRELSERVRMESGGPVTIFASLETAIRLTESENPKAHTELVALQLAGETRGVRFSDGEFSIVEDVE